MPSIAIPLSLRGQLLSGSRFEPSRLFAANEPGIWYQPSDLTTMFQDRAGTIPVTAPGQSVGLRLDKSKGLALGPELFSGTVPATVFRDAVTNSSVQLVAAVTAGKNYKITLSISGTSTGSVSFRANGSGTAFVATAAIAAGSTGAREFYMTPTASGTLVLAGDAPGASLTLSSISVKELLGNHAVANSDAARGIYGIEPFGGRRNLLTYTEDFNNAVWTKTALSVSSSILTETATTSQHSLASISVPFTSSTSPNTLTVAFRNSAGTRNIVVRLGGASGSAYAIFNPSTGLLVGTGATGTGWTLVGTPNNAVLRADGYFVASVTASDTETSGSKGAIIALSNGTTLSYLGDGVSSLDVKSVQFETGSTATAYQKVVTQYEVTEAGKPTLHYVQYDGVDDGYVTPTITPGTDKVQVFAGVRKLSDAARAFVVELSAATATQKFSLEAPTTAGGSDYRFTSTGTTGASAGSPASFASPISSIVTGIGDISSDTSVLRVNGTQVANSTADQGTGNYAANPFYIGRRAGTANPFNGRDYGLIVRFGSNLSAETIAATEAWMNGQTGAY